MSHCVKYNVHLFEGLLHICTQYMHKMPNHCECCAVFLRSFWKTPDIQGLPVNAKICLLLRVLVLLLSQFLLWCDTSINMLDASAVRLFSVTASNKSVCQLTLDPSCSILGQAGCKWYTAILFLLDAGAVTCQFAVWDIKWGRKWCLETT